MHGVFSTAAARPVSLEGHQPGGNSGPQLHAHLAPGGGHAVRQAFDASPSPSPQAAGPREAPARLGRKPPRLPVYVLDLRGSSAKKHGYVSCTETEGQCSAMKSEPECEDQDVKKNIMKKNIMQMVMMMKKTKQPPMQLLS